MPCSIQRLLHKNAITFFNNSNESPYILRSSFKLLANLKLLCHLTQRISQTPSFSSPVLVWYNPLFFSYSMLLVLLGEQHIHESYWGWSNLQNTNPAPFSTHIFFYRQNCVCGFMTYPHAFSHVFFLMVFI